MDLEIEINGMVKKNIATYFVMKSMVVRGKTIKYSENKVDVYTCEKLTYYLVSIA